MLLGCIADDVTGATDLADTLVREGLRTTLWLGVPAAGEAGPPADAVVVALKTRTVPAAEAVARSSEAAGWLRAAGAERLYFKYCSTFDSTDEGNIGPVAEALLATSGDPLTVYCPSFPAAGRTVYSGHLFVGDGLVSASSMRHHPLTPMTDPDLVAVLGRQVRRPVGLVHLRHVLAGPDAVRGRLDELAGQGVAHAVVDAVTDDDLRVIGRAVADRHLATGGSGLGGGLAAALRPTGAASAPAVVPASGPAVVLSGSCSEATNAQVAAFVGPVLRLDPCRLPGALDELAGPLRAHLAASDAPVLVSSTAGPAEVARAQSELGREEAGRRVEEALARLAVVAVEAGARRLVVAGGETAGAVAVALGLRSLAVGPTIVPGVPWTAAVDASGRELALACKSGNFGGPGFFAEAFEVLASSSAGAPRAGALPGGRR